MLPNYNFSDKVAIDIGSGSGLFSLAFKNLGAKRVLSFDYDEDSVACTKSLREKYYAKLDE